MAFDNEDGSCLECATGHAVKRKNRQSGKLFYGCSNYPKCKSTASLPRIGTSVDFLLSAVDYAKAFYDAFYDGDR